MSAARYTARGGGAMGERTGGGGMMVMGARAGGLTVAGVLRRARDVVRDGLQAWRRGDKFTASQQFDGAWLGIEGAWVRVVLDGESRGLSIEEAAAMAGVGGTPVSVPPPAVIRPRLPGVVELLPHAASVGREPGER